MSNIVADGFMLIILLVNYDEAINGINTDNNNSMNNDNKNINKQ